MTNSALTTELAIAAARLIVEEGMEFGPAKRRAGRLLKDRKLRNTLLPDNQTIENEVRTYLQLFYANTQPAELRKLRTLAAVWMQRLQAFRPHLCGAVWRGIATRHSSIHLQLFCDDSKSAEIALLDQRVTFEVASTIGQRGQRIDVLTLCCASDLGTTVSLHLSILDHDDLRGALKPDASGRSERGDLASLKRLLDST